MKPHLAALVVACLSACGAEKASERPTRSPTYDYPPPATRTAVDGRVIGADYVPPQDKLAEGGSVGSEGFRRGGGPKPGGGGESAPPVAGDPCRSLGLEDKEGHSKCGQQKRKPDPGQPPAGQEGAETE